MEARERKKTNRSRGGERGEKEEESFIQVSLSLSLLLFARVNANGFFDGCHRVSHNCTYWCKQAATFSCCKLVNKERELPHLCSMFGPHAAQPATVACKMKAQSEHVRNACMFLHAWRQFVCSVGDY